MFALTCLGNVCIKIICDKYIKQEKKNANHPSPVTLRRNTLTDNWLRRDRWIGASVTQKCHWGMLWQMWRLRFGYLSQRMVLNINALYADVTGDGWFALFVYWCRFIGCRLMVQVRNVLQKDWRICLISITNLLSRKISGWTVKHDLLHCKKPQTGM